MLSIHSSSITSATRIQLQAIGSGGRAPQGRSDCRALPCCHTAMRSCLQAQPVQKFQACVSPLRRSSLPLTVPVRQRTGLVHPTSSTLQQQRAMNVAAAAVPALNAALAGIGIGVLAAWLDAKLKSRKPDLYYTPNEFNSAVLDRCPTMQSTYQCTPFLTNGHAETILVAKLRKPPGVVYKREILITSDRGAVAIDWEHFDDDGKDLPEDAPVLILFPGLTGGSGDSYVQHAVLQARHAGVRAAVFNSRGTADSPVLTPQFYSASFTDDTREVIAHVRKRYPSSTLFAAGWSLGANILVNYLGEQGSDTPLEAAVSMCNPFDLTISNRHINEGFNRIYNWNLASSLKRIFLKHQLLWRSYEGPAQPQRVPDANTIREFDEAITIHSFDWGDVDAYYAGSSSAKRIPKVAIPLLCIQAADDPIAPEEAIPYEAIQQNPNCTLVVTPCGGHLGWAAGPGAPFSEPWTDAAVVEWLTSVHAQLQEQKAAKEGLAAQQRVLQANTVANGRNGNGVQDDNDGDNGGNGNGGSNGGSNGGYARQLEPASVTAGRAGSSSSAFSAATPLSRQTSSSSGSSTFISPLSSPSSTHSSSRPASTASSNRSSTLRHTLHQQQQQQQGSLLAAAGSEPADLMEQLWWGQGTSLASTRQSSRQQPQQQQQRVRGASSTAGRSPPSDTAAAVGGSAPPQIQQQQLIHQADAAVAAAAAAAGATATAVRDAAAPPPQAGPVVATVAAGADEQQSVRVSPFAAAAADEVFDSAPVESPEGSAALAAAAPSSSSSSPKVSGSSAAAPLAAEAQAELWQSVRWAF